MRVCKFPEMKIEREEGRRCGGAERHSEMGSPHCEWAPPALREGVRLSATLDGGDPAVAMDGQDQHALFMIMPVPTSRTAG